MSEDKYIFIFVISYCYYSSLLIFIIYFLSLVISERTKRQWRELVFGWARAIAWAAADS